MHKKDNASLYFMCLYQMTVLGIFLRHLCSPWFGKGKWDLGGDWQNN